MVVWPAVFSCGLGVHLCMCSVFYLAQRFWRLWFIAFLLGFSPPPFSPGSVSFFCFGVRVRVCVMSYLLFFPLNLAGLQAGLVAGLQVGQIYGVFYLPGFGLAVPAPWLLGTQPPFAT